MEAWGYFTGAGGVPLAGSVEAPCPKSLEPDLLMDGWCRGVLVSTFGAGCSVVLVFDCNHIRP